MPKSIEDIKTVDELFSYFPNEYTQEFITAGTPTRKAIGQYIAVLRYGTGTKEQYIESHLRPLFGDRVPPKIEQGAYDNLAKGLSAQGKGDGDLYRASYFEIQKSNPNAPEVVEIDKTLWGERVDGTAIRLSEVLVACIEGNLLDWLKEERVPHDPSESDAHNEEPVASAKEAEPVAPPDKDDAASTVSPQPDLTFGTRKSIWRRSEFLVCIGASLFAVALFLAWGSVLPPQGDLRLSYRLIDADGQPGLAPLAARHQFFSGQFLRFETDLQNTSALHVMGVYRVVSHNGDAVLAKVIKFGEGEMPHEHFEVDGLGPNSSQYVAVRVVRCPLRGCDDLSNLLPEHDIFTSNLPEIMPGTSVDLGENTRFLLALKVSPGRTQ